MSRRLYDTSFYTLDFCRELVARLQATGTYARVWHSTPRPFEGQGRYARVYVEALPVTL